MTWLLDGNVLVAALLPEHPHHHRVHHWLATIRDDSFATCPITEGTLLRMHMIHARDRSAAAAWDALAAVRAHPKHEFWPENFSFSEIPPTRLTGHRQVTDSWLAELARRNGGMLGTLDEPLSALWPEVAFLIPS
ncbi:type II toxin-antitoxin system ribonuclease VapC29 [soil metagenome]